MVVVPIPTNVSLLLRWLLTAKLRVRNVGNTILWEDEKKNQGAETSVVDKDNQKGDNMSPLDFSEFNLISYNIKADPIRLMSLSIGSDLISHDNDIT